jgi:hypothetical protein
MQVLSSGSSLYHIHAGPLAVSQLAFTTQFTLVQAARSKAELSMFDMFGHRGAPTLEGSHRRTHAKVDKI